MSIYFFQLLSFEKKTRENPRQRFFKNCCWVPDRGPPLQLRRLMAMWQEWLVHSAMCDQRRSRFHRTRPSRLRLTLKDMILTQVTLGKVEEYLIGISTPWPYDDIAIWKDGKGAMCSCINIPFVRGLGEFCVTFVGSWVLWTCPHQSAWLPGAMPAPVRYLAPDQPVPAFHSGSWRYFCPWYRGITQDLAFLISKIKAPSRSNGGRQLLFWLGSAWNFQSCQPLSMFMELDGSIAMYMKPASNLKNSKQSKN